METILVLTAESLHCSPDLLLYTMERDQFLSSPETNDYDTKAERAVGSEKVREKNS